MTHRKSSYVRIRGKRILVLGDLYDVPRIFFHPDTPERVVWVDPT